MRVGMSTRDVSCLVSCVSQGMSTMASACHPTCVPCWHQPKAGSAHFTGPLEKSRSPLNLSLDLMSVPVCGAFCCGLCAEDLAHMQGGFTIRGAGVGDPRVAAMHDALCHSTIDLHAFSVRVPDLCSHQRPGTTCVAPSVSLGCIPPAPRITHLTCAAPTARMQ